MLQQWNKQNDCRKHLFWAFCSTLFWGVFAHTYGFSHSNFSHDSLNEFNAADGWHVWKIQLGRFGIPIYRNIFRSDLTVPWLIGVMSLLWLALTVFVIVRMFQLEQLGEVFITAGIMTCNISVISIIATYIHDFDCDMFALFCAALAAYCWKIKPKVGIFPGAILLTTSMSIYQSYTCVTVALIMICCILDLKSEKKFADVMRDGLLAIGMLLIAGGMYFAALWVVTDITGIALATGTGNSLDTMQNVANGSILDGIFQTYADFFERLMNPLSGYPQALIGGVTGIVLAVIGISVAAAICSKGIGALEKALLVVIVALLPLGMNLIYILSGYIVHDLMTTAIWFVYLLAILAVRYLCKNITKERISHAVKYVVWFLVVVLLYSNVQTANVVYLKKDLEQKAYLSYMTRVLYAMEQVDDYVPGETEVVFVGVPEQINEVIPGFERYSQMTGCWVTAVTDLEDQSRAQQYFNYVLLNPIRIADNALAGTIRQQQEVLRMSAYPQEGSIQMVEDILVVKVSQ